MPYDESLANRIQSHIGSPPGMTVKKMFVGIGFLLNGNMACGDHGQKMIVRLPPDQTAEALAQPHTHVFNLTGKPMKGWVLVEPEGVQGEAELEAWIRRGVDYAASLPAK